MALLMRFFAGRPVFADRRIEPAMEQLDKFGGNTGMSDQCRRDVNVAERNCCLAQILGNRPECGYIAPGDRPGNDQGVETVVFRRPVPDRQKAFLQKILEIFQRDFFVVCGLQDDVVNPDFAGRLVGA